MTPTAVEQIIGRAATDHGFRDILFEEPDRILAVYELTVKEEEALRKLDKGSLENFAKSLDKDIVRNYSAE